MNRMGSSANFTIVQVNARLVVIRDVGPWDQHPTVTNDADYVVAFLYAKFAGRRILYFDSDGDLAELRHDRGRFTGFAPVRDTDIAVLGVAT